MHNVVDQAMQFNFLAHSGTLDLSTCPILKIAQKSKQMWHKLWIQRCLRVYNIVVTSAFSFVFKWLSSSDVKNWHCVVKT